MGLYKRLGRFYDRFSKHYGADYRALNWTSTASQEKRFKVIAEILPQHCSVNDVGCGHGDLWTYLTEKAEKSISNYWGYDLSQSVLNNISDHIKKRKEVSFYHVSGPGPLFTADYSIASGIFNTNFRISLRQQHLNTFEQVLSAMWDKSTQGIIFNVMTRKEKESYDGLFYFDQSYIEDFLANHFTDKFEVKSNYDPVDVTFFASKT